MFSNIEKDNLEYLKIFFKVTRLFDLKKAINPKSPLNFKEFEEFENPKYLETCSDPRHKNLQNEYSFDIEYEEDNEGLEYEEVYFDIIFDEEDEDDEELPREKLVRLYSKYFDDIISANNFLYITHKAIIESAPFKLNFNDKIDKIFKQKNSYLSDEEYAYLSSKISYNYEKMVSFYNIESFNPEDHNFEDIEDFTDTAELYYDQLTDFARDESLRWLDYISTQIPGLIMFSIISILEKFLIDITNFCLENNLINQNYSPENQRKSLIDNRLNYLKKECNLDFDIPKKISQIIWNTRISRNMFAHRNTENINKHLYRFKSSEVINSTLNLMGLIIISLKKKI